jgi:transcriptional regulator with XRE-family HTH domain
MLRQQPKHSSRARRVPTVRALRTKLNLTQEEFAARFHLPLGTVRDWEQGAHRPDKAAQVLLTVIAKDPDAVARSRKLANLDRIGLCSRIRNPFQTPATIHARLQACGNRNLIEPLGSSLN